MRSGRSGSTDSGPAEEYSRQFLRLVESRERTGVVRGLVSATSLGDQIDARRKDKANTLAQQMAACAAGAQPGQWGVLSGDAVWNVERALDDLAGRLERLHDLGEQGARGLAADARDSLAAMPKVRARVQLGDDRRRALVTERLAGISARASRLAVAGDGYGPLHDYRGGGLEFFLPVPHRDRPADLSRIVRRNKPVRLAVGPDRGQLRLGQIEVLPSLRRMGVGSAALADLCLFADACGKEVAGVFDPGTGAIGWLGDWYQRHGFRPTTGAMWKAGTEMFRLPRG